MNNKLKKIIVLPMNILYKINPKLETKIMFLIKNRYRLHLNKPVTLNEKIQWIKFYDRNKLMPLCADKYTVRKYVEDCGCKEILNHLLWEGRNPDEIPFEQLPNQFVIKVTHGSGFNIICRDKSELHTDKVKKQLHKWLKEKYIICYGEWFYGVVKPRIIIEEYLGGSDGKAPYDYKIYCFNGKAKLFQIHIGRFEQHRMKIYDLEWNDIEHVTMKYPNDSQLMFEKPPEINKLIEYAERLSNPFHHARVDFYIVDGKIYFGEITFTDGAGFDRITPYSFDVKLGSYLTIPVDSVNN